MFIAAIITRFKRFVDVFSCIEAKLALRRPSVFEVCTVTSHIKKGHLPLDHVILPEVGYLKDGDVQSMRLKVNRGHSDPVFF